MKVPNVTHRGGWLRGVVLSVALVGSGCVYPSERSEELRVVIDSIPDLLRGESFLLTATVVDAGGVPLENAEVFFASMDSLSVVDVSGTLVAVSVGTTEIVATALEFAEAVAEIGLVRIHDLIEIDSLSPAVVRFGDTLHLYGTGLDPERLFAVTVGGADVIVKSYTPLDPDDPHRFGRLTVWVPPPASRFSHGLVLGVEGLAISLDSSRVIQQDIYEVADQTVPWDFGELAAPVWNPALAFEYRAREDSLRFDWYRFSQADAQDRTIIVRSDQVSPETYEVFVTDSLFWDGTGQQFGIGSGSWTIGPGFYVCGGLPFAPPQLLADSVVVALQALPAGQYDILAAYEKPGGYEFSILQEYRSVLPPDDAEENDFCDLAAPLSLGVTRDLTIDNPHDIDWFRFTVGVNDKTTTFDVDAANEDADLDIYILKDELPAGLPLVGVSNIGGPTDEVAVSLLPGDYFLVVVDFAGVPTNYSLTTVTATTVLDPVAAPQMPSSKDGAPSTTLRVGR
ncbi:MAG: PPC domain-containing protein [Gemmatimonadetes bacterium]|nr:PPC domain-containing protein [Gemmatimonadota bacterium]